MTYQTVVDNAVKRAVEDTEGEVFEWSVSDAVEETCEYISKGDADKIDEYDAWCEVMDLIEVALQVAYNSDA